MSKLKLGDYDSVFLQKSWEWLNDPEVKYLTNTGNFNKEDQESWFKNLPNLKNYKIWGVSYGEQPIGVFGIKNIENGQGEYWGYIGEKHFWGKGLGKEIMSLLIEKATLTNINELLLKVIENNHRAIKLYESAGFIIEKKEKGLLYMRKKL